MPTHLFDRTAPIVIPSGYRLYVLPPRTPDVDSELYVGKIIPIDDRGYSKEAIRDIFMAETGVMECNDRWFVTANGVAFSHLDIDKHVWHWLEQTYEFTEVLDWSPFMYAEGGK